MSDTLERNPSEKEMALSAHRRRQAFHRDIEAKAAALRSPPPPVRTQESVAPPVIDPFPKFKEPWFHILEVSACKKLTMLQIKHAVCDHYGVKLDELTSHRRGPILARQRQVAMFLCYELTQATNAAVGRAFGDRDHSTVIHSYRKISALILTDPEIAETVANLRAGLEATL